MTGGGTMSVKNHNFRFNLDRAEDRKAWETLHSERVERDFKSQNRFVIRAVNDFYERHLRECDDPFLSTREKEDSFVERIISAVYERLFDNLPELIGRYFLAQGGTAIRYGESQVGNKNHISVSDSRSDISERRSDYGSEDHGFEDDEPEENELLDFGLFD